MSPPNPDDVEASLAQSDPGTAAPSTSGAPPDPAPPDPAPPLGSGPAGGGARRPRPIFLLVGIVLAAALAVGLFTSVGTPSKTQRPVPGAQVPTFSLSRLGGSGKVGVPEDGGGSGRPAILVFFASWCVDCQTEVPAIASTYRHQQKDDSPLTKVALIGVDVLDPAANALSFVHKSGVTFPVADDKDSTVMNGRFEFTGLPDTVFVEANGTIAGIHQGGGLTAAGLVSWERKLLKTT